MDWLRKLRQLPDTRKRIIVWGVTIFVGIVLIAWWVPRTIENFQNSISETQETPEYLQLPEIELPSLE